jgi:hypothetical protein
MSFLFGFSGNSRLRWRIDGVLAFLNGALTF